MNGRTRPAGALTAALLISSAACTAQAGVRPPGRAPGPVAHSTGDGVPRRAFTLVASGDVLPHDSVIRQASLAGHGAGYDFAAMLAGVKPVVSGADLAICHMEALDAISAAVLSRGGARDGPDGEPLNHPGTPTVRRAGARAGTTGNGTTGNGTTEDGAARNRAAEPGSCARAATAGRVRATARQ